MASQSPSLAGQPLRAVTSWVGPDLRRQVKMLAKTVGSMQRPTHGENIFIFSTPRSGSTWLMELILSQPGFRACDQPMDIRNPYVRRHLGIADWVDLYQKDAEGRLEPYFRDICDGRIRGLTTVWTHHRLMSKKLVFKIQNGWQERVGWLQDTFGGRVVLLLRHPIAVTISRKQLPRLEAFVKSDYARHFSSDVKKLALRIIDGGSFFEKGILHWCFELALPLRAVKRDWTIATYEQLVTDPETALGALSGRLELPHRGVMMRDIAVPSRTITKSTAETQSLVGGSDRERLVTKWRERVSEDGERVAFDIIETFGIDAYRLGRNMPIERYLLGSKDAGSAPDGAGD